MRRNSTGINTGVIMDALIASAIVKMAPGLLNQFLFKSNPLTGMTLSLAGGGAAFLAGKLLKKPNVSNIGIALVAVELLMPMLDQVLSPATTAPAITSGVADYLRLNDYVNSFEASRVIPTTSYQQAYGNRYN